MVEVVVLTLVILFGGPDGHVSVEMFDAPNQQSCELARTHAYDAAVKEHPDEVVLDARAQCSYFQMGAATHA
jgi:hypothetical protein